MDVQTILDASPNILLVSDGERIIMTNKTMLDFFGYATLQDFLQEHRCICDFFEEEEGFLGKEVEGMSWLEYIQGHPHKMHKVSLPRRGEKHYFSISAKEVSLEGGGAIFTVLNDITEIESVRERLDYALRGSSDGLWDWNLDTNEIYFSPRWKEMLGYGDDEVPNELEEWSKRVHPDDLAQALEDIKNSIENAELPYSNIHRLRHKEGHWVWILDRGNTFTNKHSKTLRMIGYHTDISKIKAYEEELKHKDELMIAQSRHAAMGEMISMIAHQWRQPISTISMCANNILADVALGTIADQTLLELSEHILKQTSELSKTIDDFRNFFKPEKMAESMSVQEIFDDVMGVIGKSLEHNNIALHFELEQVQVTTYTRELMQVCINIVKNAKEVLVERAIEAPRIVVTAKQKSQRVNITICDNAGGIEHAIMAKIFDPYFTTKQESNGTGLGLYMSKTIVEKHLQGTLNATNHEKGVCFSIELPLLLHEDRVS